MATLMSKKVALLGSSAAVLALGIAVPAAAFAEDPTPSSSNSASASDSSEAASDREQRHAEQHDKLAEALANELGIDKATVAAALDKVQDQLRSDARAARQAELKQRLDAAVQAGSLTQEQADAVLTAAEAGVLVGAGRGHGGPGR